MLLVWLSGGALRADVVETKNGAHLVGQVKKIAGGKVYLGTDFAGTIAIRQDQIVRLETDKPVVVRLKSGQRLHGRLSGRKGTVDVAGAAGPVHTSVEKIAASWPAGKPRPAGIKPARQWSYELTVDLNGKSGNHNQIGAAYGAKATLTRLKDTLVLRTSYNRQVTDKVKSADQFDAGIDYTNNYSAKNSWYARDVGGFDRVRDVSAYDTAAVGAGYDFIRSVHQVFTGRTGIAYRYENYTDPENPDLSSVGIDLGLNYTLHLPNALLKSRLAVVPTFQSMTNVGITQETDLDVPISKSMWKVRLGISNNYASRPAVGLKKLDTIYFARLVLDWRRQPRASE